MICDPCRERADRPPSRFAPPELKLGCGQDCGEPSCTCLHRGGTTGVPRKAITEAAFVKLLNEELVGIPIEGVAFSQAVERIRATYLYGQVLLIERPDHDHPHVLTGLALHPEPSDDVWTVRVDTNYDACPKDPLAPAEDVG